MTFYDHLKGNDPESKFVALAYGRHVVSGHLRASQVTGASPTHVIKLSQILGRGPWDGLQDVYFRGLRIDPTAYKFYPGIRPGSRTDLVQGVDSVFSTDVPHNSVAWARVELPAGVGDADAKASPPFGFTAIARTRKCKNYDSTGAVTDAGSYTANPARQVADLIIEVGKIPASRINWPAWVAWRDHCDELLACDYSTIPDLRGFGLTAEFYSGIAFDTLVEKRVEPYVEFVASTGGPSVLAGVDNFSAKFKGKIRARFTGNHTLTLTSDDGSRLYVYNLAVPIIDQFTSGPHTGTATIALTAGQFYDIEVHWFDSTATAELRLEWEHASLPKEVVPDHVLYPKADTKPRYEAHPFWSQPTRLDDAVLQVLALCNSTYQEADGKLKFFAYDQLTASSFAFTDDNIVDGSVRMIPRDVTTIRNYWTAKFRDLESRYIEEPLSPITYELPELVELAGRRIEGDTINFFNSTRFQVYRVLKAVADRSAKAKFTIELRGDADTYPVLAGDRVTVDVGLLGFAGRDCLVVASNDSSSEETADERRFLLKEWI
jgi:hypothetical protein